MTNIRPAVRDDISAVRELLVASWHATYDAILGADVVTDITDRWHSLENLMAQLLVPNAVFLVAASGTSLCATAYATAGCDGEVAIQRVYVLPGKQGQGLGRKLMAAIEAAFPAATGFTLEVEPRNTRAIAFYEDLGFAKCGTGGACGGDSQAAIAHLVMTRRPA